MTKTSEFLAKHPAPWRVEQAKAPCEWNSFGDEVRWEPCEAWYVKDANGEVVLTVDHPATAYLIAAVPDMRDALAITFSWPASSRAKELVAAALEKGETP